MKTHKAVSLVFVWRTTEHALELKFDRLNHLFTLEQFVGIEEGEVFLLRVRHGFEFAVLDGVPGLPLEDGERVTEQL